ncbi:GNAT family N-acetyltransferase [Microbispora sp. NEAU-D428]|uniref:GNAT family N-acetyltransferase n=1 Tax=Microbispora sitophila TaxID=2771537 RepID=UPI001868DE62|nr:GNAT family N-acetyltransferase [Microbispora sitophila]MBE3013544.1 GNAT family N-acetyltransferase [Microbispora sitophila]
MAELIVRPAADADMPGLRAVAEHFGTLGLWPEQPDFVDAERAFGEVLVGEVDGAIVGFGGTLRRGTVTHLGDLFVLPDHQSSRVGRTILSRLLPGDTPKVTFASDDKRALALYIRNGMRPRCPLFYLKRGPLGDQSVRRASGQAAPGEADVHAVAAMDAHVSGGDRTSTLTWYAGLPDVTLHVSGSGYAFVRTAGDRVVIGPAGGATPQDCADIVLEAANAHPGARLVHVAVPGTHPLLALLLDAGWHIGDMDTLLTSEDFMRLDCYAPHPDLG